MSKVRIINDKTGEVRFVSPFVANQTETLKHKGYRVEDLPQKKEDPIPEQGLVSDTINEPLVEETIQEDENLNEPIKEETNSIEAPTDELVFDDLIEEQPAKVKGKPGPKPKNTVTE